MRRLLIALSLAASPAAAAAQNDALTVTAAEPEWRQASEIHVRLAGNRFEPAELRLEAGRPVRLVFFNHGRGPMSLEAASFFAASRVRAGENGAFDGRGMVVRPGESRSITLVPSPGTYTLRSQSLLRRIIGMNATIIVAPASGED